MCPAGCPENTRLACTSGTSKINPFHSCQGVQVPVQARTLSPQHCRPDLSMVLRPPQPNIYITTLKAGPKRAGTHEKRETSLLAPISKYMLWTSRSVTWLWNLMQRTVLNRHRRNKCNQSPVLLSNQVQVYPNSFRPVPNYYLYIFYMIVILL
jgi:hypothetical protein